MEPSPTVTDLLILYIREYLPHKAPSTQVQQTYLLRRISHELGALPLTELTPLRLRAWRDALRQRYKPGTVRCYLESLSAALTVAVNELEWLPVHPMRKVRKPPASPGRTRCLAPHEQLRLLQACHASHSPYLYAIVVVALYTGCRKSEVRCLRWEDIDFEQRCLRLQRTKNKEHRVVPLLGHALEVLQQEVHIRRLHIPWVFPRPDGRGPVDIDTSWSKVVKRAGIEDFRFHDLRHSTASFLALSGATPLEIAEVLGHKTMQMVKRYVHLNNSHMSEVVERMIHKFLQHPGAQKPEP